MEFYFSGLLREVLVMHMRTKVLKGESYISSCFWPKLCLTAGSACTCLPLLGHPHQQERF